ncbi:MAG TPA: DUF2339 domain-containing protein [Desulfosporosinus sp.]|nr:DUF2339 domain-containing protein [Desulfosporosinus sp.]
MGTPEDMQRLLDKHEEFSEDFTKVINGYKRDNIVLQNSALKNSLEESQLLSAGLKDRVNALMEDNLKLKTTLSEQIFDERLQLLKLSQRKIDSYFAGVEEKEKNSLISLENKVTSSLDALIKDLENVVDVEKSTLLVELIGMKAKVQASVNHHSIDLETRLDAIKDGMQSSYRELGSLEVSEAILKKRAKSNNLELRIGLNWLNWLGAFLILLGIGALAKYSYSNWLGEYAKGLSIFVISLVFLAAGEVLMRRAREQFAKGIISIGIGGLYSSILISYFVLGIMSSEIALALSFVVAMASVLLVKRYESRTISIFSLVGGYLPVLLYHFTSPEIGNISSLILIAYVLMLNSTIMVTSTFKKWNSVKYFSFVSGMLFFLATLNISNDVYINILYSFSMFALFTVMFLLNPIKEKIGKLLPGDILVLGANTFITSVVTYFLFDGDKFLTDYKGILSVIFCIIYFALAKMVQAWTEDSKETVWLFHVAALAFSFLIIPFQYGYVWLSLGWVVEGVIVITLSFRVKSRLLEYMGWLAYLAACVSFFSVREIYIDYYHLKYFVMIASAAFLLHRYFAFGKYEQDILTWRGQALKIFKYLALLNIFIYFQKESHQLFLSYFKPLLEVRQAYTSDFVSSAIVAIVLFVFAYTLSKIDWLQDKVVSIATSGLFIAFSLMMITINGWYPVLSPDHLNLAVELISLALLMVLNSLAILKAKSTVLKIIVFKGRGLEWYPVVLGVYLLMISYTFMTSQFSWVSYIGYLVNIMYMAYALLFVMYGFKNKYVLVRRAGLGLAFMVCIKLFLVDLSGLETLGRIISFFGIGGIALFISYAYQKMSREYSTIERG